MLFGNWPIISQAYSGKILAAQNNTQIKSGLILHKQMKAKIEQGRKQEVMASVYLFPILLENAEVNWISWIFNINEY